MALKLSATTSFCQVSSSSTTTHHAFLCPKYSHLFKFHASSSWRTSARSEGTESRVNEQERTALPGSLSSTRMQLDLLEQLTSANDSSSDDGGHESDGSRSYLKGMTIRDQLAQLIGDRDGDFSIQLGTKNLKKVSAKFLTVSQKRNIKRQAYLDEVSQRNDSVFFATIGAFVILPPFIILGIAIATGYVQLFP